MKLVTLTKSEYERLCSFDYCDLYSLKSGAKNTYIATGIEIFVGVNRYGRLFINVNFYPEGHKTFDFGDLAGAIKWAKSRVNVIDDTVLIGGAEDA